MREVSVGEWHHQSYFVQKGMRPTVQRGGWMWGHKFRGGSIVERREGESQESGGGWSDGGSEWIQRHLTSKIPKSW